jgi:hypothetical protein
MYIPKITTVNQSAENDTPIAVDNTGLAFTTDKKMVNNTLSYALVVVACKAGMDWLLDVPKEWRIVAFEKCGPIIKESMRINASSKATMLSLLSHVEFCSIENVGA